MSDLAIRNVAKGLILLWCISLVSRNMAAISFGTSTKMGAAVFLLSVLHLLSVLLTSLGSLYHLCCITWRTGVRSETTSGFWIASVRDTSRLQKYFSATDVAKVSLSQDLKWLQLAETQQSTASARNFLQDILLCLQALDNLWQKRGFPAIILHHATLIVDGASSEEWRYHLIFIKKPPWSISTCVRVMSKR